MHTSLFFPFTGTTWANDTCLQSSRMPFRNRTRQRSFYLSNHTAATNDTHWLTVPCRYGIAGLKALARSKFVDQIDLHLSSSEFPEACQEAYESTFHSDRGLRDVIIQAFRANPSLSLRPDVEIMVRETPGLAFELFRMASGLPVSS
jgi:hypothetical protein